MNLQICKWYNDSDSPVIFMIDDFANVWVDTNGNNIVDKGEDWGFNLNKINSSFNYLCENILKNFPNLKVTFFTPVGKRVGMIKNSKIKSISKSINDSKESTLFFRNINNNKKFEIAYHGLTHGVIGNTNNDFIQEWVSYNTLEDALESIKRGKAIYEETFLNKPKGGKYPGYESNEFSDLSLELSGFIWWCRYWNRGIISESEFSISGGDFNAKSNYDIKYFGKDRKLVDIPSTIDGGLYRNILDLRNDKCIKRLIKYLLRGVLIKKRNNTIEYLLRNKLVISIQEHISPARDDGRIQYPNIFSDTKSLNKIFKFLNNKNVWYCTCSELAYYCLMRDSLEIEIINENKFSFHNIQKNEINLISLNGLDDKKVKAPNNEIFISKNNVINLKVMEGVYEVE
ncbi:hypothetical protein ACV3T9_10350 [Clostridium perfringens]